jgi:hypothetical protein
MHRTMLFLSICLILAARMALADETPAVPATPAPVPAEVRAACEADVGKLCAGVQPGGGRIMQCLARHKAEVSDACKQAISRARSRQ